MMELSSNISPSPTVLARTSAAKASKESIQEYKMIAFVFGATGATGKYVVEEALKNQKFGKVVAVTRRTIDDVNTIWSIDEKDKIKLHVHTINYNGTLQNLFEEYGVLFDKHNDIDNIFYCLGTTHKDAGSVEKFKEIDFGYLMYLTNYIRIHDIDIKRFDLISAINASENYSERIHAYPAVKAACENVVIGTEVKLKGWCNEETNIELGRPVAAQIGIWQPPLLERGDVARVGERLALWIPFFPKISTRTLAIAMVEAASQGLTNEGHVTRIEYFQKSDILKYNSST